MSARRLPLRKDPRGFQIPDTASGLAFQRALEAAGLILLEVFFKQVGSLAVDPGDPEIDLALKGLGHAAGALGMSRLSWMTGIAETGDTRSAKSPHPEDQAYAEAMRRVLDWLLIWDPTDIDAPPTIRRPWPPPPTVRLDLNELWATSMPVHSRNTTAGMTGPDIRRAAARAGTRKPE